MQCDKYERGDGEKRAGKTQRTNEQDRRGETDEERIIKEEGEISIDTPRAQHPLGLSVDP